MIKPLAERPPPAQVRFDADLGMHVVGAPGQVRDVLRDPVTYSPANALDAHTALSGRALRALSAAGFALPPVLANCTDPAVHLPVRRALAGLFSSARVAAAEPVARALTRARLAEVGAEVRSGRPVDLVADVAGEVSVRVLLGLLHLPDVSDGELTRLKAWSRASLELFWGWPDAIRQDRLVDAAVSYSGWLRDRTAAARAAPARDVFSRLIGLGLSDAQVCSATYFLLIAGHETTQQLLATAFETALADRALWRRLALDPDQVESTVEVLLAERSPVHTWRRITTAPVTIGGTPIPAGAPLLLRLTGTGGPPDLAFGFGIHRCLGAALARMEAAVLLRETAQALPDIVLAEAGPPRIDLLSFRAPCRVLVHATGMRERSTGSCP